jgi:hypothetical protein
MVAMTEEKADLFEGEARVFAQEVHRNVPRLRDGSRPALAGERLDGDTVARGNSLEQSVGIGRLGDGRLQSSERAGGTVETNWCAHEICVGDDAMEKALELAHIVRSTICDESGDIERESDALFGGLGLDDRQASLGVRWLDIGYETPLEARGQASGESGHGSGRAVAGDDDMTAAGVEIVETVEELFLGPALIGEELHVVNQKQLG